MSMYGIKLPYTITKRDQKRLLMGNPLTPAEVQHILDHVRAGGEDAYRIDPAGFFQVIDPATGDSLYHMAAKSNNAVENTKHMADQYTDDRSWFGKWTHHASLTHQNHDGDTPLHVAARSGNLILVICLYRHFCQNWSVVCPEETLVTGDDDPPEVDVYTGEEDDWWSAPPLAFLLTKNISGRDAAEVARAEGQDEVAKWLEDVMSRLDPEGTRRVETNMAHLVQAAREAHGHARMEEWTSDGVEALSRRLSTM